MNYQNHFQHILKRDNLSTLKDKSCEVKVNKRHVGSKELELPDEESSVKAIQVPFGSLVNKECPKEHSCDTVQHVDSRKLMSLSKCKRVTPENQDAFVSAICPKIQDEFFTYQKKKGAFVNATCKKKRRTGHPKKWIHRVVHESPNNKHDHSAVMRVKKMDDHPTKKQQKKRKSLDEDKWRNLLEASSIQESRKQHVFYGAVYCLYKCQQRVKKRSVAWRPFPKSILCQVCELATMYPYPKGQRPELLIDWVSPDRSADVTLSDYGRILCGINGNGRKDEYRSDSVFMTDPPVNRDNKLNALKLQHIRAWEAVPGKRGTHDGNTRYHMMNYNLQSNFKPWS